MARKGKPREESRRSKEGERETKKEKKEKERERRRRMGKRLCVTLLTRKSV